MLFQLSKMPFSSYLDINLLLILCDSQNVYLICEAFLVWRVIPTVPLGSILYDHISLISLFGSVSQTVFESLKGMAVSFSLSYDLGF